MARAPAFNKERVNSFFELYDTIKTPNGITSPAKIFYMDETGLQTVQKPQKVMAQKGKHQVGGIVSAERGETTTCHMMTGKAVGPALCGFFFVDAALAVLLICLFCHHLS